jgi:hypothetical protein
MASEQAEQARLDAARAAEAHASAARAEASEGAAKLGEGVSRLTGSEGTRAAFFEVGAVGSKVEEGAAAAAAAAADLGHRAADAARHAAKAVSEKAAGAAEVVREGLTRSGEAITGSARSAGGYVAEHLPRVEHVERTEAGRMSDDLLAQAMAASPESQAMGGAPGALPTDAELRAAKEEAGHRAHGWIATARTAGSPPRARLDRSRERAPRWRRPRG